MIDAEVLLQAYHYLSSAVAQAFAALIALTAIFYIFRQGELMKVRESIIKSMMSVMEAHGLPETSDPSLKRSASHEAEVVEMAQKLLDQNIAPIVKLQLFKAIEAWSEVFSFLTLIYGSGIMRAKLNASYKHATEGKACLSAGYVGVAAR